MLLSDCCFWHLLGFSVKMYIRTTSTVSLYFFWRKFEDFLTFQDFFPYPDPDDSGYVLGCVAPLDRSVWKKKEKVAPFLNWLQIEAGLIILLIQQALFQIWSWLPQIPQGRLFWWLSQYFSEHVLLNMPSLSHFPAFFLLFDWSANV